MIIGLWEWYDSVVRITNLPLKHVVSMISSKFSSAVIVMDGSELQIIWTCISPGTSMDWKSSIDRSWVISTPLPWITFSETRFGIETLHPTVTSKTKDISQIDRIKDWIRIAKDSLEWLKVIQTLQPALSVNYLAGYQIERLRNTIRSNSEVLAPPLENFLFILISSVTKSPKWWPIPSSNETSSDIFIHFLLWKFISIHVCAHIGDCQHWLDQIFAWSILHWMGLLSVQPTPAAYLKKTGRETKAIG